MSASGRRLVLAHLYPEHMNLYGDRGNVLALAQRARWRGIAFEVRPVEVGQGWEPPAYDLFFMGGGEDRQQARIAGDFLDRGAGLLRVLEAGTPMLAVCGAYQLLGRYYITAGGERLPGLGWFDAYTEPGSGRAVGDVVVRTDLPLEPATLVGFENHGGRTFLEEGGETRPLGRVLLGQGNNGRDGGEGAVKGRAIGTYLHGSLLPKNPHLADLLLSWALERGGQDPALEPLDAAEEWRAHAVIVGRVPGGRLTREGSGKRALERG